MQGRIVRVGMTKENRFQSQVLLDATKIRLSSCLEQRVAFELVIQLLLKLTAVKRIVLSGWSKTAARSSRAGCNGRLVR